MDVEDGVQMVNEIYKKQREEKAFKMYIAKYANMSEENHMEFEEFYKPNQVNEPVEDKSAAEILKDVREMMNSHSVGGEK